VRAVRVHAVGGPEALVVEDLPDPEPGPGEVVVDVAASGVNFIDVYERTGRYPLATPFLAGQEGAGTVAALGPGVEGVTVGDRVGWAAEVGAGYATAVVVRADRLVPVPDAVDLETAAAVLLQGMTAHYLTSDTFAVATGDPVLVHAAAGGTGALVTTLATLRGGRVVGTVSSAAKEAVARAAGAAEVLRRDRVDDLAGAVRAWSGGGVAVAYDGGGAATFDASLASLRRRGTLVLFGAASGPVPPFDLQRLNSGGSLFVTRPTMRDYVVTTPELRSRAAAVLGLVAAGRVDVRVDERFPLDRAADAHRVLESGRTTGKLLVMP
jgi:NADPH2:quinone reductase